MRKPGVEQGSAEQLTEAFASVIADLTEGRLTFGVPFDHQSAAALASNIDTGSIAEALFLATAHRPALYEVHICARSSDAPELEPREIINTTVTGPRLLITLLEQLIEEITHRETNDQGEQRT